MASTIVRVYLPDPPEQAALDLIAATLDPVPDGIRAEVDAVGRISVAVLYRAGLDAATEGSVRAQLLAALTTRQEPDPEPARADQIVGVRSELAEILDLSRQILAAVTTTPAP